MEYKILKVPNNCSLEHAKKALNNIRLQYHPDKIQHLPKSEQDKNVHYLQLASEAYMIIEDRHKVNEAITKLNDRSSFNFVNRHNNISASMPTQVYTSSYSYSNLNGNEREHGTINGKTATSEEMKTLRPRSVHGSIFYNLI